MHGAAQFDETPAVRHCLPAPSPTPAAATPPGPAIGSRARIAGRHGDGAGRSHRRAGVAAVAVAATLIAGAGMAAGSTATAASVRAPELVVTSAHSGIRTVAASGTLASHVAGLTYLLSNGAIVASTPDLARGLGLGGAHVILASVPSRVTALDAEPYESQQLYLPQITAPAANLRGALGQGITVAIVDTGIDSTHPDLAAQVVGRVNFAPDDPAAGLNGHGTHVAGLVAAARNGIGIVGVAPAAQLLDVRVLGRDGSGSTAGVAQGVQWAVAHGAKIISMSLGSTDNDPLLATVIAQASDAGVLVVAAAGNGYTTGNAANYPGAYPTAFAVAAVDSSNAHAYFSNTGSYVDIAAPGVSILSDYPGNQLARMSGTSMATPEVSGAAADVWSAHPNWTAVQVRAALESHALDLGAAGKDEAFGAGLVQVNAAVGTIENTSPTTNPTTSPTASPTEPVPSRVTISGPAAVARGSLISIKGIVKDRSGRAMAGVIVTLRSRTVLSEPWVSVGTVTSDSLGHIAVSSTFAEASLYQWVTKVGTGYVGSAPLLVRQLSRVALHARSTGSLTRVSVTVDHGQVGTVVQLLRSVDGSRWVEVAAARTTTGDALTFALSSGTHTALVKVLTHADATNAAAESSSLVVRLR